MSKENNSIQNESDGSKENDHLVQYSPERDMNYGSTSLSENIREGVENDSAGHNDDDIVEYNGDPETISMPEQSRSTLSFVQKIGFGLGHVYNDLCAGVWFSYTLLFMQAVLQVPAPEAGALVMLGQISDAISTPIVGILADRYGTKRQWHISGTFLVFISFPMIFSLCPWCSNAPHWWTPVYFAIFIIIFQFAWAIVQITHLSMIPEMSITVKDRADLTATRYSASVCSNVIVYLVTWSLLQGHNSFEKNLGPSDAYRFRDISLILTLIGLTMSVLFHFSLSVSGYKRRRQLAIDCFGASSSNRATNSETNRHLRQTSSETDSLIPGSQSRNSLPKLRRKNFLKSPLLYINALLYVFARLFMTTSLVYMPLWLDERSWQSQFNKNSSNPSIISEDSEIGIDHLATVPLVSFLFSFIASMSLKFFNRWIGHQMAYFIGSVVSIVACLWIALAPLDFSQFKLFSIAILFGTGSSITMISSLCITADMVGNHTYQGGFIYSAVTFADKLITGVVVVIIETLKCQKRQDCPEYYRNVLAYACGVSAILGLLTLSLLRCVKKPRSNISRVNSISS